MISVLLVNIYLVLTAVHPLAIAWKSNIKDIYTYVYLWYKLCYALIFQGMGLDART